MTMATTGPLDSIVSRIESYMGEFLMSRQQLIDAGNKINQALAVAQGGGTAKIGTKIFTIGELQNLSARNTQLLNENADLQSRINSFKDAYADIASGASSIADALVGEVDETGEIPPWYDTPGLLGSSGGGLGVLPGVVVPAAYLMGVGAVLATAVYLFISNLRSHLGNVAGDIGSNLIVYGGITLLALWYAKKQRWI
jgi:hypothetical protein